MTQTVDISNLTNLAAIEPLDWDGYADAKDSQPLPPAGEYVLQAPFSFEPAAFEPTRDGNFGARIDPTIVGPQAAGTVLRFTRISAKSFERRSKKVSMIGDYLRACGVSGVPTSTAQDLANAIASTAGRTYKVFGDWEAYHKNPADGAIFKLKGQKNFPANADGTQTGWVTVTNGATDDNGQPLQIRANFKISRFIPAV